MTTQQTAAETVIASHAATYQMDSVRTSHSQITIIKRPNRRTGRPTYVVEIVRGGYISTWDIKDTEAAARRSATRAWVRASGKEEMICA